MTARVHIPFTKVQLFCQKWDIQELALFGSVLRDNFRQDSDVDVLVTLHDTTRLSLYDWVEMIQELSDMFGRPVDLVEKTTIRNPFRRYHILKEHEVVYAR